MKCAFSWTFYSLETICSLISDKLFQLQTKTFGMSRDYWKFLEQLYEHNGHNSVKPIDVSHNIESKYASAWTMIDNSKLQYGHVFPRTIETNSCGHSQHNIAQCRRVPLLDMYKEIPNVWWDKSRYIYLSEFIRHVKVTI